MRASFVLVGALFLLAAGFPTVPAASPQPAVRILHDVADDGYTYVGNPVHFGYVVLTGDEKLTVHQQGHIQIVQNGIVLYETSKDGDAAHDYDALNTFEIAFPTAGPYEVVAEVPQSGGLVLRDTFKGNVLPAEHTTIAKFDVKAPKTAAAMVPVDFEYVLRDANGAILEHTDTLFEVRRAADDFLLFRTHTHTHKDPQKVVYAFQQAGTYKVRLTGYSAFPTPDSVAFAPVSQWLTIPVGGMANVGGAPAPAMPAAKGQSKYVLLQGIDPQTESTPFSQFRISTLVYDTESKKFVPHVNFVAQITDALGHLLFRTESLHEYDGDFDVVVNEPTFGSYMLQVAAVRGDWVARADKQFIVAPAAPEPPFSAGPVIVSATGLDRLTSGAPQKIVFHTRTLAGTPAMHSEIEFQVLPESLEAPTILMNKLHTHESADFEVAVTFPTGGTYQLLLDAETIHGDPTPAYYWEKVGGALQVPVKVSQGPILPWVVPATDGGLVDTQPVAKNLPGFEVAVALAALGLLAFARRRYA